MEAKPNPYNARKPWQTFEEQPFESADSLFTGPGIDPYSDDEDESPVENTATSQPETSSDSVDFKKRYDDLKKHHDRTITETREEIKQLKSLVESLRTPQTTETAKPQVDIEALRAENPELVDVVETVSSHQSEDLRQRLAEIDAREKKIAKQEAQAFLSKAHPDYVEITQDPAFSNWAAEQPQQIQDWIFNNPYDGGLAAKALTLYKNEMGLGNVEVTEETTPTTIEDFNAADVASLVPTVPSGSEGGNQPRVWSKREIEKMSVDEYERYETEIDEAIRLGNIRP